MLVSGKLLPHGIHHRGNVNIEKIIDSPNVIIYNFLRDLFTKIPTILIINRVMKSGKPQIRNAIFVKTKVSDQPYRPFIKLSIDGNSANANINWIIIIKATCWIAMSLFFIPETCLISRQEPFPAEK